MQNPHLHIKGATGSSVIFANRLLDVLFVNSGAGLVFDLGCSSSLNTPILLKIKPRVFFTYVLDNVCLAQSSVKISLPAPQGTILSSPRANPLSFAEISKLGQNVWKVNTEGGF